MGARKADDHENKSNRQGKPRKCYNPLYVTHPRPRQYHP
jgi:hypothetical protein